MIFPRRLFLLTFVAVTSFLSCIPVFAQDSLQRQEYPVNVSDAVDNRSFNWSFARDVTVGGRIFDTALKTNSNGTYYAWHDGNPQPEQLVFRNQGYELFEAWIGRKEGNRKVEEFSILGDGQEIYKSPKIGSDTAPIKISVPVRGYRAITLVVQQTLEGRYSGDNNNGDAIWGEPIFVKMIQPARVSSPVNGQIKVLLNGNQIPLNVAPLRLNGRIVVPMRDIFEAMGASVEWNSAMQTIIATKGNVKIGLAINNYMASVGTTNRNRTVQLDQAPVILGGSTMVPLRFVSEALGAKVSWDEYQSIVTITN